MVFCALLASAVDHTEALNKYIGSISHGGVKEEVVSAGVACRERGGVPHFEKGVPTPFSSPSFGGTDVKTTLSHSLQSVLSANSSTTHISHMLHDCTGCISISENE